MQKCGANLVCYYTRTEPAAEWPDGVKMVRWLCVLHLSLTVALVPPVARLSRHVLCSGAAYDYCVQSLGCTAEEAAKAEGKLLPRSAESRTREKIDYVCNWLQSELGLSDAESGGVTVTEVMPQSAAAEQRVDVGVGGVARDDSLDEEGDALELRGDLLGREGNVLVQPAAARRERRGESCAAIAFSRQKIELPKEILEPSSGL